jgi:putative transposase
LNEVRVEKKIGFGSSVSTHAMHLSNDKGVITSYKSKSLICLLNLFCAVEQISTSTDNVNVVGSENQAPIQRIVAIDPGVRCFSTTYSAVDNMITEWGSTDNMILLFRWKKKCDRLRAMLKQSEQGFVFDRRTNDAIPVNHRWRYRIHRKMLRLETRIRNCVADLHWKLARWLCENYEVILLPVFSTQQMMRKNNPFTGKRQRKIHKTTVRKMQLWSHFSFRQRLLHRAKEYGDKCIVKIVTEEFTSKCCGCCGMINQNLGSSKTFYCPNPFCGYIADRDANGARNILLKWLTEILQYNINGPTGSWGSLPSLR